MRLSMSMRLAGDFLHVMYTKDEQMLVFYSIFDLLWTGMSSSVSSVAFSRFRELKQFEKHGDRLSRNGISSPCREKECSAFPKHSDRLRGKRCNSTPKRPDWPCSQLTGCINGGEQAGTLRCHLTSNQCQD